MGYEYVFQGVALKDNKGKYFVIRPDEKKPMVSNKITLPNDAKLEDGNIWTNMSDEEILIRLNSTDYKIPHSGYDRCSLFRNADQSMSNVFQSIIFNEENYDQGDMHDLVTNPERVTIQKDGFYIPIYQVEMTGSVVSDYDAQVLLNGVDEIMCIHAEAAPATTGNISMHNTKPIYLNAGDYLELQVKSSKVAGINVISDNTFFILVRLF